MGQLIEVNQGEIAVKFTTPKQGKVTFEELGLTDEQLVIDGGFLRITFDLEGIKEHDYFAVPTLEFDYKENCAETHWQCDFNGETILDKVDHGGSSTILMLNRTKLSELEHRHENKLIIHAEFPIPVHIIASESYINFFK